MSVWLSPAGLRQRKDVEPSPRYKLVDKDQVGGWCRKGVQYLLNK